MRRQPQETRRLRQIIVLIDRGREEAAESRRKKTFLTARSRLWLGLPWPTIINAPSLPEKSRPCF
jgi:hypothetical protein